jgi:hypothetical protein
MCRGSSRLSIDCLATPVFLARSASPVSHDCRFPAHRRPLSSTPPPNRPRSALWSSRFRISKCIGVDYFGEPRCRLLSRVLFVKLAVKSAPGEVISAPGRSESMRPSAFPHISIFGSRWGCNNLCFMFDTSTIVVDLVKELISDRAYRRQPCLIFGQLAYGFLFGIDRPSFVRRRFVFPISNTVTSSILPRLFPEVLQGSLCIQACNCREVRLRTLTVSSLPMLLAAVA